MLIDGEWKTVEDIADDFDVSVGSVGDIVYASYDRDGYDGTAYVLTRINGELMEVYGDHCSCYGLEGQWEPEPVSEADLEFRAKNGCLPSQAVYARALAELRRTKQCQPSS